MWGVLRDFWKIKDICRISHYKSPLEIKFRSCGLAYPGKNRWEVLEEILNFISFIVFSYTSFKTGMCIFIKIVKNEGNNNLGLVR